MKNDIVFTGLVLYICVFICDATISCQSPQQVSYLLTTDSSVPSDMLVGNIQAGSNPETCLAVCTASATCAATLFTKPDSCSLLTTQIDKGSKLVDKVGTDYYQKVCISSNSAVCASSFLRSPQHLLVGYARDVLSATSLEECLSQCLDKTDTNGGYNCGSALYYYSDKSCILNSETKKNVPDVFTSSNANDGDVEYLDNNCFGSYTPWGNWLECLATGKQSRTRTCNIASTCKGQSTEQQACTPPTTSTIATTTTTIATTVAPTRVDPSNPCQSGSYVDGCGEYCQQFAKHGYANYIECIKNGNSNYKSQEGPGPVACAGYTSLGYSNYGDCLRAKYNPVVSQK